jgi:hypothetical protein
VYTKHKPAAMLRIKSANFPKSKMAAAAILKFEKVNSFLRDKAIFTTFQQHTLGINHYRSLWSKIIIFQKSKMALTPS